MLHGSTDWAGQVIATGSKSHEDATRTVLHGGSPSLGFLTPAYFAEPGQKSLYHKQPCGSRQAAPEAERQAHGGTEESGMTTGYGSTTQRQVRSGSNGLAIAGLVCGIVGIFLFNVILGPLAVVFGGIGMRNARQGAGNHGMALAGVILGVFDIVLFIVLLAVANSNGGFSWHVG
ncbi:DUF4190 domain-containing protein [Streptomyces sp. IBSBF 2435]|uniref:DUF4190 domain-containing protein n=1 Tax=Streptomyces sp. IBSBF 2435 TaxID=2903531 RepID=UPI003FA7CE3E